VTQTGSNRRTVLALGIALGTALLAIAFLLGRESAQLPPSRTVEAELSPRRGVEREAEPWAEEQIPRQWPEWADLRDEGEQQPAGSTVITTEAIERQTHDKLYRAGTARGADRQPGPPDSAPETPDSTVAAYFQEIDVIHSGEGAGDPNAFAMGLIKAGLGGSTSGFDQLIADTKQMELQMQRVTPPPSCRSYHEASLEALVESRQMLETMKQAITSRDIEQLNAVALQSKSLQGKAEAIREMRKQLVVSSTGY